MVMKRSLAVFPSLRGQRVFVTGGATAVGAAIVSAFAAQGAQVAFVDVADEDSQNLVADIQAQGFGTVWWRHCDVCDVAALQAALADAGRALGDFSILVNNVASDDRHSLESVTPDYWDERQATNLRHMFFAIQTVAPDMIAAGGGSIINMGSNSWWEAGGGFPAYATAKAAVHGLTRTMARDLGRHRIRVNAVVPGWIMTERQKTLWATPEALEAHQRRQCLPDLIDPVYVARMVLFLASDDAAMCSASNYMVEAGSI